MRGRSGDPRLQLSVCGSRRSRFSHGRGNNVARFPSPFPLGAFHDSGRLQHLQNSHVHRKLPRHHLCPYQSDIIQKSFLWEMKCIGRHAQRRKVPCLSQTQSSNCNFRAVSPFGLQNCFPESPLSSAARVSGFVSKLIVRPSPGLFR